MGSNQKTQDPFLRLLRGLFDVSCRPSGIDGSFLQAGTVEQGLMEKICDHRLSALMSRRMPEIIPDRVLSVMEQDYYYNLARNMLIMEIVKSISRRAREKGLDLLLFKGIVLAHCVYGDLGVRSMSDVDVLVRKDDLSAVHEILMSLDYRTTACVAEIMRYPQSYQRNSITYRPPPGGGVHWHLYWHIVNFLPAQTRTAEHIDMGRIWRESTEVDMDGVRVKSFSETDNLIYLCFHGMHHCFNPLILLCDIAACVDSYGDSFDWDGVIDKARHWGLHRYVYHALFLTRELCAVACPDRVFERLRPRRLSGPEIRYLDAMRRHGLSSFDSAECLEWAMGEGIMARISFFLRLFFPARHELALIRQRSISEISARDYGRRWLHAFGHFAQ